MAFLSKGLLGAGLPVMAAGIYVAITRQWSLALGLLKPWGLAWFLALAAPWVVLVSIRNPEFFQFFFIDEQFGRLLTTRHQRWEPYWFYFLVVPAGFFPWIAYLPGPWPASGPRVTGWPRSPAPSYSTWCGSAPSSCSLP